MSVKHIFYAIVILNLVVSCSSKTTDKPENKANEEKVLEVIPTGIEYVEQLIDLLESGKLRINKTTTTELSSIYEIEANDYYMNKKIQLEDHVLYINFTISNDIINKVSFATLSNSPKDFSYITNLMSQHFGEDCLLTYNTNDSLVDNATKNWNLDSLSIEFETFSDLNSGYEITIE